MSIPNLDSVGMYYLILTDFLGISFWFALPTTNVNEIAIWYWLISLGKDVTSQSRLLSMYYLY